MHHDSNEKNVSLKNIVIHLSLPRCHVLQSLILYRCSLCSSSFQKNPMNGSIKIAKTIARMISMNSHVQSRMFRIFSFAVFIRTTSHLWNIALSVFRHRAVHCRVRHLTIYGTVTTRVLLRWPVRGFPRGIHADNHFHIACRYGHYDNPIMI